MRSLIHLSDVDTGFDKHNVLVFSLDSSTANLPRGTPDEIRSVRLQEQIEGRVQAIPGVQSDSFAFFTFNEGAWTDRVLFQGIPRTPENGDQVFFNITGNGFFSTMGIPLIAGRTFNAQDTQNSPEGGSDQRNHGAPLLSEWFGYRTPLWYWRNSRPSRRDRGDRRRQGCQIQLRSTKAR